MKTVPTNVIGINTDRIPTSIQTACSSCEVKEIVLRSKGAYINYLIVRFNDDNEVHYLLTKPFFHNRIGDQLSEDGRQRESVEFNHGGDEEKCNELMDYAYVSDDVFSNVNCREPDRFAWKDHL